MSLDLPKQQLKPILKELISEVIEDYALANAIKEGKDSENVSREEIFALLQEEES